MPGHFSNSGQEEKRQVGNVSRRHSFTDAKEWNFFMWLEGSVKGIKYASVCEGV